MAISVTLPGRERQAVKRLAAFGEKMNWEVVGASAEEKMGLKKKNKYAECIALEKLWPPN